MKVLHKLQHEWVVNISMSYIPNDWIISTQRSGKTIYNNIIQCNYINYKRVFRVEYVYNCT